MHRIKLASPSFGPEELRAVREVLRSGWVVHGPKNKELEQLIAGYFSVPHCILVNSGTSALYAALKALEIRGEVIVPSFTMSATVNAIIIAGARPVFADVDERTGNIDPANIEKKITKKTEAIMPVHFAGQPANMGAIGAIARAHHLHLIEDAAETMGATWEGRLAGTFGDAGCFSFWASKAITTGEGGAIITANNRLAKWIRAFIAHGITTTTSDRQKSVKPWYRDAIMPGHNFRMSNIAAAIGVEQIKKINRLNECRRKLAAQLTELLKSVPDIRPMERLPEADHVYQMYVIRVSRRIRNQLVRFLRSEGIEASVHFDPPVHRQTYYRRQFGTQHLPNTMALAETVITLPLFPDMRYGQLKRIAKTLFCGIQHT
jgi:perosamine synthetase